MTFVLQEKTEVLGTTELSSDGVAVLEIVDATETATIWTQKLYAAVTDAQSGQMNLVSVAPRPSLWVSVCFVRTCGT